VYIRAGVDTLRRALSCSPLAMWGLALAVCAYPAGLSAQGAAPKGPHCFAIQVHLNGQPIDGPQSVTLKTRKLENTVPLNAQCFAVPSGMLESELIQISFSVPGNNIRMADIPTDFFSGQWDVELADKRFTKDVVVPKHANVSEMCAVVFRGADTDQSLSQPQCRTAARASN